MRDRKDAEVKEMRGQRIHRTWRWALEALVYTTSDRSPPEAGDRATSAVII